MQPSDPLNNLIDAIDLVLDFNETIQLDLVWKYKNQIIKKCTSDFNWWKQSKLLNTLCHLKIYQPSQTNTTKDTKNTDIN